MINPYDKDSQPFSWAWQNQKMWADAFAPTRDIIDKAWAPKPVPPITYKPFPAHHQPTDASVDPHTAGIPPGLISHAEEMRRWHGRRRAQPSRLPGTTAPVPSPALDADRRDARAFRLCCRIALVVFLGTVLYLRLRGG